MVRLTILCDNTIGKPFPGIAEHGFACLVETDAGSWLFDTGQGLGILHNARLLGRDLRGLRGVVLSHGHYDHCGGLPQVLSCATGMDVFAHPDLFAPRYRRAPGDFRYLGIPFQRPYLESLGARFELGREFRPLAPGISLSGEVPRRTSFEKGEPSLVVQGAGDEWLSDPFADDLSLVVETGRGLVLVLGCAHAGLVNIMRHVLEQTGRDRLYAVIGGTHLVMADDEQFEATLQALKDFRVERIGVSHCTGLQRGAQMHTRLPDRHFFAGVGTVLEF